MSATDKQGGTDLDLDDLLDEISVFHPGQWANEHSPTLGEWYAVCDEEGIRAYFGKEEDAFFFRLALINARLNKIR